MTEQAASSTAEADVFNGQEPTRAEYDSWRTTGKVPERFKPAEKVDAAATDAQKETESEAKGAESADAAETSEEQHQEPRKPRNAAQRIAQLEAAIESEWGKDDPDLIKIGQLNATIDKINGRPKRKTEPAPVNQPSQEQPKQQAPQNYAEWEKQFEPEKWLEQYAKDNPTASYEKANAAMFSYMLGAREHFGNIERRIAAERAALDSKVSEAKERYEDFDEIKSTFLSRTLSDQGPLIPPQVLGIINDSDVLPDLLYVLAEDESELDKFISLAKTNPNKAIRQIAALENSITEELSKPDGGQPQKAPEKRQTAAPKPVTPVGGSSSRGFDVNDESLSEDEWVRKRNAQLGIK